MIILALNIIIFLVAVILPSITWWWVFIPIAIFVLLFTNRRVAIVLAGLVLDSLYATEVYTLPYLTIGSFILGLLSIYFRDKMRTPGF